MRSAPSLLASLVLLLGAGACVPKQAISQAESALLRDPGSGRAWLDLGDTYRKAGRQDEAAQCYGRALELAPNDPEVRDRIARTGLSALSELERQALAEPSNDELWGDLGDHYASHGQSDQALRAYLYAMRLDPSDSEWREKVVELGGTAEAVAMSEAGLNLDDDEQVGDLADLYLESGNLARACELYARANELDPADGEWVDKVISNCPDRTPVPGYEPEYGGEGSIGGLSGAEGYSIGGGMIGDYADSESELAAGRAALAAGDRPGAIAHFEAALRTDPTDREALSALMVASGRKATDLLTDLAEANGENDEVWGDLGDAWLAVGDQPRARAAYERAATLDPGDAEWRRQLELLAIEGSSPPQ